MKEHRYVDIGRIMDEIFEAAENFKDAFKDEFPFGPHWRGEHFRWGDKADFYPAYSYPPTNVYMKADRSLVFEFALAGFGEENINIEFKGDYMVFSAKVDKDMMPGEDVRYFKRRLKLKDIEEQRYFVPNDKFDQEKAKAVFKNGILSVVIPPREEYSSQEGIKVEIVKEDEK